MIMTTLADDRKLHWSSTGARHTQARVSETGMKQTVPDAHLGQPLDEHPAQVRSVVRDAGAHGGLAQGFARPRKKAYNMKHARNGINFFDLS